MLRCEINVLPTPVGELVEPLPFDRLRDRKRTSIFHRIYNERTLIHVSFFNPILTVLNFLSGFWSTKADKKIFSLTFPYLAKESTLLDVPI